MTARILGALTLLALAACDRTGADVARREGETPGATAAASTAAGPMTPAHVLDTGSFYTITKDACPGTAGTAVTWNLGDVLDKLNSNRRLPRAKRGGQDVPRPPADKYNRQWPTNVDMDVSSLSGPGTSGHVLITIVLDITNKPNKPGLRFLRPVPSALPTGPDPASTDSSVAVMGPQTGDWFCGRTDIAVAADGKTESVTFGVKAPTNGARSINVGLMVPANRETGENQMWLPIFLDPNVRNEG